MSDDLCDFYAVWSKDGRVLHAMHYQRLTLAEVLAAMGLRSSQDDVRDAHHVEVGRYVLSTEMEEAGDPANRN